MGLCFIDHCTLNFLVSKIQLRTQCNFGNILKSFKCMDTWLREVTFPILSPITFNVRSKTVLTVKSIVLFEQESREIYSCVFKLAFIITTVKCYILVDQSLLSFCDPMKRISAKESVSNYFFEFLRAPV